MHDTGREDTGSSFSFKRCATPVGNRRPDRFWGGQTDPEVILVGLQNESAERHAVARDPATVPSLLAPEVER